jgi:hypothetical protein
LSVLLLASLGWQAAPWRIALKEYTEDRVFPDTPVCFTLSPNETASYLSDMTYKADSWILSNAQYFSPIDDWIDKKDRYLRRKSFAELAIYLYVADHLGDHHVCSHFDPIMSEFVNSHEFISLIKRHSKQLLLYGAAVNYVKSKGLLSKEANDAVVSVLRRKAVWAVERVPHRMLDLWNFLLVFGWDGSTIEIPSILKNSCIHFQPDVIESTLHEAYAFTHILLFYYNFGISHEDFPCELLPNDIEDVITGLVLRYCAEDNFDVVLELIYVAAMHRQLPKWLLKFALSSLCSKIEGIDIVKGPKNPNQDEFKGREANYIEWAENYHTVLVSASTFRCLAINWNNIDERVNNKIDNLTQNECASLYKCGCSFASLADYELPLGAYQTKLALQENNPLSNKFLVLSQEFLKYQRNPDGSYGYWADEELLYCRAGGDKQEFHREIVSPVSTLCDEAVANNA